MDVPRIIFHKNSTSNIFVRCQFGKIAPRHKGLHIYYGVVDVSVVDGFGEGISRRPSSGLYRFVTTHSVRRSHINLVGL